MGELCPGPKELLFTAVSFAASTVRSILHIHCTTTMVLDKIFFMTKISQANQPYKGQYVTTLNCFYLHPSVEASYMC